MKNKIKNITLSLLAAASLSACIGDLDQYPTDPDMVTEVDVFEDVASAKGALSKLYAALAITGQKGPDGQADISGIDEGSTQFTRMLYNLNELTTDHAVVGWGDPGLPNLHAMSWSSSNQWVEGMYYRLAQEISFTNSFISNAQPLAQTEDEVKTFIAEARFLRAYSYYNMIDLFGDIPLVTEIDTELPHMSSREEIFYFIESELQDIESDMTGSRGNEYGRVDVTASYALLSRLYLNAEVYIGESKYDECIVYTDKVLNGGYSINTSDMNGNGSAYDELFLADNNSNGAQNEFIFNVNFDGIQTQTWGGMSFMIHAAVGGSMNPVEYGINGGWGGTRTTKALVEKFEATDFNDNDEPVQWKDHRAMFHTDGQNYEITTIANTFSDGYAISKFKNVDVNGNPGSDPNGDHPDTDLPIIRLAEMYLNYAEATLRGGAGGSTAKALDLVNQLRERGYGSTAGNINEGELDLDFLLDERSRELYWEGQRRTDLIRYSYFTTTQYLWPFKADIPTGSGTDSFKKLFPIPANIIAVNPNLIQNPGY